MTRPAANLPAVPRRAVFLDRDGTICEEMGYLNHIRRFHVFPFAAAAIRRLNRKGIPVVVVTNQSGASRGFFPEMLVHTAHRRMNAILRRSGARVDGIYYCPHEKKHNCDCRKPRPGMLRRAARDLNLQLRGSWLVSDRYDDIRMIHRAGGRGALVLTGYGRGEYAWNRRKWPRQPDLVAEDLAVAVSRILAEW
jgi:D-glycero-D-manno-heptose 1,7-bisphosphate phosphatase